MWILFQSVSCSPCTYLAVVERLFLGAGLDEELVCQSSVLCTVTIAVRGNPARLPVSIESSLQTCVWGKTHTDKKGLLWLSFLNILTPIVINLYKFSCVSDNVGNDVENVKYRVSFYTPFLIWLCLTSEQSLPSHWASDTSQPQDTHTHTHTHTHL